MQATINSADKLNTIIVTSQGQSSCLSNAKSLSDKTCLKLAGLQGPKVSPIGGGRWKRYNCRFAGRQRKGCATHWNSWILRVSLTSGKQINHSVWGRRDGPCNRVAGHGHDASLAAPVEPGIQIHFSVLRKRSAAAGVARGVPRRIEIDWHGNEYPPTSQDRFEGAQRRRAGAHAAGIAGEPACRNGDRQKPKHGIAPVCAGAAMP